MCPIEQPDVDGRNFLWATCTVKKQRVFHLQSFSISLFRVSSICHFPNCFRFWFSKFLPPLFFQTDISAKCFFFRSDSPVELKVKSRARFSGINRIFELERVAYCGPGMLINHLHPYFHIAQLFYDANFMPNSHSIQPCTLQSRNSKTVTNSTPRKAGYQSNYFYMSFARLTRFKEHFNQISPFECSI